MEMLLDVLSWILLIGGCFFCFTGALGLLRFPDFFTRMHATSVSETMGAGMILIGLMLQSGWTLTLPKLIIILLFSLLAGTTATHAMAKSALASGLQPQLSGKLKDSHGGSPSKL
jgi:multicomponent Na+:H+ antiporter subunit G